MSPLTKPASPPTNVLPRPPWSFGGLIHLTPASSTEHENTTGGRSTLTTVIRRDRALCQLGAPLRKTQLNTDVTYVLLILSRNYEMIRDVPFYGHTVQLEPESAES